MYQYQMAHIIAISLIWELRTFKAALNGNFKVCQFQRFFVLNYQVSVRVKIKVKKSKK